ncbi:MAG: hypothetical protein IIA23_08850 [Chloroflexi bacterium]|nr:hypothetical protein [Chloroflexota bacterium]
MADFVLALDQGTSSSRAILFDRDLVVTDVRRIPSDYVAMGLPAREASLHYHQADGYVHAVDIRTIDRPAWRTGATALYFRFMGLRTLRHVGTADHLHVSPNTGLEFLPREVTQEKLRRLAEAVRQAEGVLV